MRREYSLIIAAMEVEFDALKNQLNEYREIKFDNDNLIEFEFNNEMYLLGLGKIGKVSTAFFMGKLFSTFKIKRVFNIGTSGAVDNRLNISDVIIADRVGYYDVDVTIFNYKEGQVPGMPEYYIPDLEYINSKKIDPKYHVVKGLILSGDSFVTRDFYNRSNLKNREGVVACEMESGAVAQCCHIAKIPFVIVRSISDIVTKEDNHIAIDKNAELSSTNSALVLLELLK